MSLRIRDLKAYVPAQDFKQSKRFYAALGFSLSPGFGGTADVSLDGQCFRLQPYYVKDWADNFMIVMGVDDVDAWHRRAAEVIAAGGFGCARLKPPESVGDSRVLHVIDPSGVLLIFVGDAVNAVGACEGVKP